MSKKIDRVQAMADFLASPEGYLMVPKKLAIERLAKWLHDPSRGQDKWGTRRGDGKECWHEDARKAIKAMEGKV
jgi:hypothetical protein